MRLPQTKIIAVSALAVALSACTMMKDAFEGDKVNYKSSGKIQPLEIPPDLTRPSTNDTFAVPDPRGTATFSEFSRERQVLGDPSRVTVLPTAENVRLERQGNQRWLVVKSEPAAVWNVVREFWQETGFIIDTENPGAGVMETDWAETYAKMPDDNATRGFLAKLLRNTRIGVDSPAVAGERVKFRTRLERGSEAGTTEVYISHRGMEEVIDKNQYTPDKKVGDATVWKIRPSDPGLEAEMLNRLMARFGVKQEMAKLELSASGVAPLQQTRATLIKGKDGSGTLSVNDQFDRAWRRVGLALDRVGFTVEDRDRSKGLYFVRYVNPEADNKSEKQTKNIFARMFTKDDKKAPPAAKGGDPKGGDQYRIRVKDAEDVSEVNVLSKDGNAEKSDTANRILALLYEQLK